MIPFIFVNHFTGMVKKCLYAYLCKVKLRYEGFVAVLSLVLLALVCNSGALHVPAAGVAAAQECCVRNTDNASFQQFHDRDSIRQKRTAT